MFRIPNLAVAQSGPGPGVLYVFNGLINHCTLILKSKRTDRRGGRAATAFDSTRIDLNRHAFELYRGRFWTGPGRHFNQPGQARGNIWNHMRYHSQHLWFHVHASVKSYFSYEMRIWYHGIIGMNFTMKSHVKSYSGQMISYVCKIIYLAIS